MSSDVDWKAPPPSSVGIPSAAVNALRRTASGTQTQATTFLWELPDAVHHEELRRNMRQ